MTERQVGEQHGTGTKSSGRNQSGQLRADARRSRRGWSACRAGRRRRKRPEWVTGWKTTGAPPGARRPKRTIAPTSCSLTPRSTAAASETVSAGLGAAIERPLLLVAQVPPPDRQMGRALEARRTAGRRRTPISASASASAKRGSRARRMPLVFSITSGIAAALGGGSIVQDLRGGSRARRPRAGPSSGSPSARDERVEHRLDLLERSARSRAAAGARSRRSRSGSRGCRRC